jgi:hypothetical protein
MLGSQNKIAPGWSVARMTNRYVSPAAESGRPKPAGGQAGATRRVPMAGGRLDVEPAGGQMVNKFVKKYFLPLDALQPKTWLSWE